MNRGRKWEFKFWYSSFVELLLTLIRQCLHWQHNDPHYSPHHSQRQHWDQPHQRHCQHQVSKMISTSYIYPNPALKWWWSWRGTGLKSRDRHGKPAQRWGWLAISCCVHKPMLSRDPELREYIHRISTHFVSRLWKQTSQQVGLYIDKRGGSRFFRSCSFGKYDQASHSMQFSIQNRNLFRDWLSFTLLRFLAIGWKFESYHFLNQSKTIVNSSDAPTKFPVLGKENFSVFKSGYFIWFLRAFWLSSKRTLNSPRKMTWSIRGRCWAQSTEAWSRTNSASSMRAKLHLKIHRSIRHKQHYNFNWKSIKRTPSMNY